MRAQIHDHTGGRINGSCVIRISRRFEVSISTIDDEAAVFDNLIHECVATHSSSARGIRNAIDYAQGLENAACCCSPRGPEPECAVHTYDRL